MLESSTPVSIFNRLIPLDCLLVQLIAIAFFLILEIYSETFLILAKAESNLDASQVINIGMIEIAAEMLEVSKGISELTP